MLLHDYLLGDDVLLTAVKACIYTFSREKKLDKFIIVLSSHYQEKYENTHLFFTS